MADPQPALPQTSVRADKPVVSHARWIGLATLLSRITGMVRDMALVQFFGATWVSDAFQYAFQFPNLFRRLFAEGAMSAVFVPTFSSTLEKEGREGAWRLLGRTMALLTVTVVAVLIVVELGILAIWLLLPAESVAGVAIEATSGGLASSAPNNESAARGLILSLTALMFPFMVTVCILSLLSSILNCIGSFFTAAIMPLVVNVVMWAGIVWGGPLLSRTDPRVQIFGVAISVLVSGALQLVLLVPALRSNGVPWRWQLDFRDPTVRRMLKLMLPVIIGQGALLIGVFLDQQVCIHLTRLQGQSRDGRLFGIPFQYPLQEGALTVLTIAQRMYQFPLGVLAISLATAALPAFSRLAARREWPGWAQELRSSLRLSVFVGLLSGGLMLVLAEPIIRLLFEYKKFGPDDTGRAARALAWYGAGMWAFCAQHIVLRGFYSISDVRTPLKLSCVLLPLNLLISVVLVWFEPVRESAFGISTSITSGLNVIIGLAILQRRTSAPVLNASVLRACAIMLLASVVSGALIWALRGPFATLGDSLASATAGIVERLSSRISPATVVKVVGRFVQVFGPLGLGTGVFLLLTSVLGLPETRVLLPRRRAVAGIA